MKNAIYIFIGSGLGGLFRFWLSRFINSFNVIAFPLGTFVVNIVACFLLGFGIGLADNMLIPSRTRTFWIIGFCGGFSTFSTFSNEILALLQTNNHLTNIIYISSSIVTCVASIYLGVILAHNI